MHTPRLPIRALCLAASLAISSHSAFAQDPLKAAPDVYKATTNNQYVRVLDINLKPGARSAMHSHPGYVAVALTPCKLRFTEPKGKSQEVEFKGGEVVWRDPESHSVENIGTADCHALNIEVKAAKRKAK